METSTIWWAYFGQTLCSQ